jgi:hypothetical protein
MIHGTGSPKRSAPQQLRVDLRLGDTDGSGARRRGHASAQGNLKIGVVNVGRLLEQAPQSKVVTDKLQKEFEPRQQTLLAGRQKLQTQQERFQKDQAVMGARKSV